MSQVETANVDTKTGFNHVYENIYYEARAVGFLGIPRLDFAAGWRAEAGRVPHVRHPCGHFSHRWG